jgi:hypothetical protein
VSVEVLAVAGPTGVDISGRSRASSLPIGYSSLPSDVETSAAGLERKKPKAFCRSTSRVRQTAGRSDGTVVAAAIYLAASCDHHSRSLSVCELRQQCGKVLRDLRVLYACNTTKYLPPGIPRGFPPIAPPIASHAYIRLTLVLGRNTGVFERFPYALGGGPGSPSARGFERGLRGISHVSLDHLSVP